MKKFIVNPDGELVAEYFGGQVEVHEGYFLHNGQTFLFDFTESNIIESDVAEVGMVFKGGGEFAFPAAVEAPQDSAALQSERDRKLLTVNTRCDELLRALKAGYPEGEVLSWDQQVIEARKLGADANAVTPLLSAIAAQRELDVTTLAVRVLEKADAYATASGAIIGARQKLESAISSASTAEELATIDVHAGWPA